MTPGFLTRLLPLILLFFYLSAYGETDACLLNNVTTAIIKQAQPPTKAGLNYPFDNDTLKNDAIMRDAVDAIDKKTKVSRDHQIPYVAGYDVHQKDAHQLYIDKNLPSSYQSPSTGKTVYVDKYLKVHEAVEKSLLDSLGLKYQQAHQIALRVEEEAVKADGVSWDEYNQFMEKYIGGIYERCLHHHLGELPPDFDLTPYLDEKDDDLVVRMRDAMHHRNGH